MTINFNNNLNLPNMADIIESWEYAIEALLIQKINKDYEIIEITKKITFNGILQANNQQLNIKEIGERSWGNFTLHTKYNFRLDDIILMNGIKYRVVGVSPYQDNNYGYFEYQLLEDYR